MAVLTLDYLRGTWAARRTINGAPDAFVGTATFTDAPDGLVWEETGRLRLGAHDGPASRTLRIGPGGVRFDDGRPFHPFTAGALRHLCAPDTYDGVWTVHDAERFTVRWSVTGPGRADEIVCDYRRRADGETVDGRCAAVTRSTL